MAKATAPASKKPTPTTIRIDDLIPDIKNPRKDLQPSDPEFKKINTSIERFGFLEPIVFNTKTKKVISGHQRLKIARKQGKKSLHVVPLGAYSWAFTDDDLKELSEQDENAANIALNKAQGDWDMERLMANLQELKAIGYDITTTGFDNDEVNQSLANLSGLEVSDPLKEWKGMPEFSSEDKTAAKSVMVNFETLKDMKDFSDHIKQKITEKTKSIWYPYKPRDDVRSKVYKQGVEVNE